MSLVMRKPAFCICENKDADQRRGNKMTKFKLWKKWQKMIWGLYPNVMHIFSSWQKHQ